MKIIPMLKRVFEKNGFPKEEIDEALKELEENLGLVKENPGTLKGDKKQ